MPFHTIAGNIDPVPLHVAYGLWWGEKFTEVGSQRISLGLVGTLKEPQTERKQRELEQPMGKLDGGRILALSSKLWLLVLAQRYQGSCFKHLKGLPIF